MAEPYVELRADVVAEHVAIIDAVAQATPGASRASVLRQIIGEWVEREIHRCTLVQRVQPRKPLAAETMRVCGGDRPV
jgi:hypothetical protein